MVHAQTVQQIYEAFGRGNIPAILEKLDESVDWEYGARTDIPYLVHRSGRNEAAGFFEALSAFEMHKFQPKTLLENDNVVVALIDVELTVKSTGKRVAEEDEVHIWHFNDAGLVSRFAHKIDTHAHWLANGGKAAD